MTTEGGPPWVTRTLVGIVVATFFSDVGHEVVTAVLPMYLAAHGLGPAALGAIEGAADLAFSLSKLAGGVVGHRVARKLPWATAGYLVTTLGTGLLAVVQGLAAVLALRTAAWFGRGFRSPLRDFLLADEVGPTHFGRAYGFERSADMIGAVVGPLVAAALVWQGLPFDQIILWSVLPSAVSVVSIAALTRDRATGPAPADAAPPPRSARLPRRYWLFVGGEPEARRAGIGQRARRLRLERVRRPHAGRRLGHGRLRHYGRRRRSRRPVDGDAGGAQGDLV